jgi:hypothetical protein
VLFEFELGEDLIIFSRVGDEEKVLNAVVKSE